MIQIKDVTKLYPAKESGNGTGKDAVSIHALDHISLHVAPGEWLSIMGPSGSGKSTLVNLIGCLDRPSSGEIWLDGQNVAGISAAELNRVRAEKIGFIFQQFHLIPFLTAVENVMLAQYFHSMTDEKEAVDALTRVGLGRSRPSPALAAFRWRAAARLHCPRPNQRSENHPRRRTHRQPRRAERRNRSPPPARVSSAGTHHRHGHARSRRRAPR